MTIIHGKIESLKRIRATLNENGIYRFNSIGDINNFVESYDLERNEVIKKVENDLDLEINTLSTKKTKLNDDYDQLKNSETNTIQEKIAALKSKKDYFASKNQDNIIWVWDMLRSFILKFRVKWIEKHFDKTILKKTISSFLYLEEASAKLERTISNRTELISQRSSPKTQELDKIKKVIDGLYPQIAGAIGEDLVVKELSNLSDKYILFNDFTLNFDPPIYNRKENDRIFSIQVDHLLVTNSGVFIIETKNWSKGSIESLDMRSPVKQIRRSSYALFVVLNSGSNIQLKNHHWGDKQVPLKSLVVLINNKPKEKFKFVTVKTLNELNRYVTCFEPIFDDKEVREVSSFLDLMRH